jgi:CheY-like chemotaxis protein/HPt (histidine-containing phosphotransfer) domain-containing protein
MGGTLELRSEEGVGTTVVFELPGASAAEATAPDPTKLTAAAAAAVPAAAASRLRAATSVLYIEDNPSNVRLVEKIFGLSSDLGLSVAREGSEGVALARELRPDLILLDLHLPDMPGEQVLAALRGDERLAQTPVIIVSADASPLQAKRLLAAGADGYLTKPFDIDQLLAAVRTRGTAAPVEAQELSDGLVDAPMAASLHVLSGNPAVGPAQIGQMLETFHSDARAMLRSLHEAADEPNLAAVEREAHRLAGGAGAVAAGRFRGLCKEIENHARQGDRDRVRELDAGLDELYEQTWEALTREFAAELRQLPAAAEQRPAG